jgi:hypothetical protein
VLSNQSLSRLSDQPIHLRQLGAEEIHWLSDLQRSPGFQLWEQALQAWHQDQMEAILKEQDASKIVRMRDETVGARKALELLATMIQRSSNHQQRVSR